MRKMKQQATSLLTIVFVMLISSCNLFIDEEFRELPSDEITITHTGDGYNEPTTITGRNYFITYQYQPNVRVLTDEAQSYIKNVEEDELGWTYIIYFDEDAPENLLPRKGEVITCDESEKFSFGIAAEVFSAGYMDHAYIVCAIMSDFNDVFKVFTGDVDFNVDDEEEYEDNNTAETGMKKSKMADDDEIDDEDDDFMVKFNDNPDGSSSAKFRIPVDFKIEDTNEKDENSSSSYALWSDGEKSFIQNDMTIGKFHFGDITGDERFIQWTFKNKYLIDITIEGNYNFKFKYNKETKNLLPRKLRKLRIPKLCTLRFKLTCSFDFTGELGMEGTLRHEASCDFELNTNNSYKPQFSNPYFRASPYGTIYGMAETRLTFIGSIGLLGQCINIQFKPYGRITCKSSLPSLFGTGDHFDLRKNHALSLVSAPGIDIVGVLQLKLKELLNDLYAVDDLKVAVQLLKFAHQSILTIKINYGKNGKEDFFMSFIQGAGDNLLDFTKELEKLVNEYEKIVKETGKYYGAKIADKKFPDIKIYSYDGEKDDICLSKRWYWYPVLDDKSIYVRRDDIEEGEKQAYYVSLFIKERGIYAELLNDSFYPYLDIYKIMDNGGEKHYKCIPFNIMGPWMKPHQAVIDKEFDKKNYIQAGWAWNDNKGQEPELLLDEGETYKAYVCYSEYGPGKPFLYDKPITIVTKLPEVVISDVRNLKTEDMNGDNDDITYSFNVYLTVKGAKQFSSYKLTLLNDKGNWVADTEIRKPKDVKNKEFPFQITRHDYKPFVVTIKPTAVFKDKKSGDAVIKGSDVDYKPVKIKVDYWDSGEIQILNE